jgi:four helix bundle protein
MLQSSLPACLKTPVLRTGGWNTSQIGLPRRSSTLAVIRFCEHLPKDETARTLGRQLLRSGTSVGANYRAAHRARSTPDFISKLGVVLEEADESGYWIDLLSAAGKADRDATTPLQKEANELVAIAISSINTARRRSRPPQ